MKVSIVLCECSPAPWPGLARDICTLKSRTSVISAAASFSSETPRPIRLKTSRRCCGNAWSRKVTGCGVRVLKRATRFSISATDHCLAMASSPLSRRRAPADRERLLLFAAPRAPGRRRGLGRRFELVGDRDSAAAVHLAFEFGLGFQPVFLGRALRAAGRLPQVVGAGFDSLVGFAAHRAPQASLRG